MILDHIVNVIGIKKDPPNGGSNIPENTNQDLDTHIIQSDK
ncbi:hypothetical protein GCHA_4669 [Paraglaciecola chathamensis S18K6]|uniref:Uncharacterized protein n=1 Tax=Paraglaciecola chathamensis S18K6 TaxID=1127672 RepID=A0AAV3V6S3_9ALTE|nr:hypothetical protein GCHA_4669 [Paraglaciecola chathamensis S18K6]